MPTRGADDLDVRVAIQRLREPVALHRNRPRSLTLGASIQKMASIIRHGAPFVPDRIMGLEIQNNAAEIKLRAERRAGRNLTQIISPILETGFSHLSCGRNLTVKIIFWNF